MRSIRVILQIFSIVFILISSSNAQASQNQCATLLLESESTQLSTSQRIVIAYRRILTETNSSFIKADDLIEMQKQGDSQLKGYFFLSDTGDSERSILREGLNSVLKYTEANEVETESLKSELALVLREELKARGIQSESIEKSVAEREVVKQFIETSTGAIFEQVKWPNLGWAQKDPSELIWIVLKRREFSHEGKTKDGMVVDSEATRACDQVGGRLPTVEEFERLKNYFDQGRKTSQLDEARRADLAKVFPEMKTHNFWTASIAGANADNGYAFDAYDGRIREISRSKFSGAVVCVGK